MNTEQTLAIRKAIDYEKRAYDLYISLLKKSPNRNLQILFNTLALEELKHASLLQECLRGGDIGQAKLKARVREEEFSVTDKILPTIDMDGFREAFAMAISKEHGEQSRYHELFLAEEDQMLKDLYLFLQGEEERHERLLRAEFAKL